MTASQQKPGLLETAPTQSDPSKSALPTSRKLLQSFVEQSHDGIIIIDDNALVLEWNKGQEAITGIPRSEALHRPIWDLQYRLAPADKKTPDFIAQTKERVLRGLSQGLDLERVLEDEIVRPDGCKRVLQSILFGIRDEGHNIAGAIVRDVTERRQLEEELRERETLLLEAERLAHVGHWQQELATGRWTWSDEVFRMLGEDPGAFEPSYEALLQIVLPEDRQRVAEAISKTSTDGVGRRGEYRVMTARGLVRSLFATVDLLRDAHGKPTRVIGTVHDITERKSMEEQLAEASRRKDEFLAVLSHELRNPLAPIRSSLYVLARAEPGGEVAKRVQTIIERQVSHLSGLVDDLLDVARISRGKTKLERQLIELGELVRRTTDDHSQTFLSNQVHLETKTQSDPLWIWADRIRIGQILGNLLTNAAKFTPSGGRVLVTLQQERESAILRVQDSGVGIHQSVLDRIFEPFMQGKGDHPGLGLGLALVKGLTELHGGSVGVRSDGPGHGAEFFVRLPLQSQSEKNVEADSRAPRRPRRVLIVEDNVDAAVSLQDALRLDGHDVKVARTGREGIDTARAFAPEVVLCDIGLPDVDGYDVARAVLADGALKETRLVALTGYAQPEDVKKAEKAGFQVHLAKPPDLGRIARLLAEIPEARG